MIRVDLLNGYSSSVSLSFNLPNMKKRRPELIRMPFLFAEKEPLRSDSKILKKRLRLAKNIFLVLLFPIKCSHKFNQVA